MKLIRKSKKKISKVIHKTNIRRKKLVMRRRKRTMKALMTVENGDRVWRNEVGQFHREDGPAIEYANGENEWWVHDKRHREDGPAVEWADGTMLWYLHGRKHREDGPAIEYANGTKEWWVCGKRHREDGPAFVGANGDKIWYIHGKQHRDDGPATEWVNGDKTWWVHGKKYTQTGFTNLLVQHHLKLQLLNRVLPPGSEILVDQYVCKKITKVNS